MMRMLVVGAVIVMIAGCTPKETHRELQTFSPVMVDITKLEAKDYSELVTAVNAGYSPEKKEFVDAKLIREEGMFLYYHVLSGATTACYRVTVDKNRGKIINVQPDCAIEE